jgi:hypothetical protein
MRFWWQKEKEVSLPDNFVVSFKEDDRLVASFNSAALKALAKSGALNNEFKNTIFDAAKTQTEVSVDLDKNLGGTGTLGQVTSLSLTLPFYSGRFIAEPRNAVMTLTPQDFTLLTMNEVLSKSLCKKAFDAAIELLDRRSSKDGQCCDEAGEQMTATRKLKDVEISVSMPKDRVSSRSTFAFQ